LGNVSRIHHLPLNSKFPLTFGGHWEFQGPAAASSTEHCSGLICSFLGFPNQVPFRGTYLFGSFKSMNSISLNIWASLKKFPFQTMLLLWLDSGSEVSFTPWIISGSQQVILINVQGLSYSQATLN